MLCLPGLFFSPSIARLFQHFFHGKINKFRFPHQNPLHTQQQQHHHQDNTNYYDP